MVNTVNAVSPNGSPLPHSHIVLVICGATIPGLDWTSSYEAVCRVQLIVLDLLQSAGLFVAVAFADESGFHLVCPVAGPASNEFVAPLQAAFNAAVEGYGLTVEVTIKEMSPDLAASAAPNIEKVGERLASVATVPLGDAVASVLASLAEIGCVLSES